ncbi:ABC transporter ATP-binding protein [Streptomyces sp. A1277]|uniref:ABC transporter ATP-binding protein n=1 Tax=Streptomyces sp. A1277 TaxID=2563103 RepID=UPI0010A22CA9|nr:ABC transporter ATP-binding protein [Streptomyces sp. A1277]THA35060.1 ABC transporter ATP-binding protein [Streptomyces sp. A1277]
MSGSDPVLRVRDVHKSYRRRKVLEGVNFDLPPGQLTGIVGENGAGKSTLLRILIGDLPLDHGSVQSQGVMGYCPQETVLHEAFTVVQHLRFLQTAYALDTLDRAHEVLEILHCTDYLNDRIATLSGGTRQKLNLTLALMHGPQVLLLDEPYQGFDWETYLRFWDLAQDLRDRGCSVLVVSHLAYDASRLDRMYRLHNGVLVESERTGVSPAHAATNPASTSGVRS